MKIKVCGLNNLENIESIERILGVDYTGFIFVEQSPRNAFNLVKPPAKTDGVERVGVFMNATVEEIRTKIELFELDIIQLHGNETPEFCEEVRTFSKVFKAFGIESSSDLEELAAYQNVCNAFVLDKKTVKGGGSGEQYNWQILEAYRFETPFLLSGGIGLSDAPALKQLNLPNCIGYDVNSRFESSPGIKKNEELALFIKQIKQ